MADRGSSHRTGVVHVIDLDTDVLDRWNSSTFPLGSTEINFNLSGSGWPTTPLHTGARQSRIKVEDMLKRLGKLPKTVARGRTVRIHCNCRVRYN